MEGNLTWTLSSFNTKSSPYVFKEVSDHIKVNNKKELFIRLWIPQKQIEFNPIAAAGVQNKNSGLVHLQFVSESTYISKRYF